MQKHLLSKSDLTLKWALEIAQSKEAAAQNTQQLKEGDASTFSVESVTISNRKEGCYRCGGRNHNFVLLGVLFQVHKNAIITVAKDTLPEAAAQKELHLRPRHQKAWEQRKAGQSQVGTS